MSGYVELPEGWTRVSSSGPGPFVTSEIVRAPDGTELRWESRRHRKQSPARRRAARTADHSRKESVWWRPHRRDWWMAVLFAIGALCFTAGGIASQWAASRPWIGATFFVGSLFFTSAAYLQYAEAVNAERGLGPRTHRVRWRPASWEPGRIDWLATLVQLIGTLLFNISTFAALHHNLTTKQTNARVWAPDVFGSVAFGASAIASPVEPSSGEPVSARIANAGTSDGGLCFLIGALLLMPEAANEQRAAEAGAPADKQLAPASSQLQ